MKKAVIVMNLGGPDELASVKPFLFNLFNDKFIIGLPGALRWLAAKWISNRRAAKAQKIYQKIGGKSPLLELTQEQAKALEAALKDKGEYKVFVSMRYWNPMSPVVIKNVKNYAPDHIILLPLYPQFSTTTTASSFSDWDKAAKAAGLKVPTTKLCCYPVDRSFIVSHVNLIRDSYWRAAEHGKPRILFSAHGIPEKCVGKGDPYQWQVEQTVAAIVQVLAIEEVDYALCYQSRVGPLKWLGPSIDEEIQSAGAARTPLVVVPVSFVSEHAETLVELDITYRSMATLQGVPDYQRVPALGTDSYFISALADLCAGIDTAEKICSFGKSPFCPRNFIRCGSHALPVEG